MTETIELAKAISNLVACSAEAVPATLMNHQIEEAAAIIGAVIERCHEDGVVLQRVCMSSELANELGLVEGARLPHGGCPKLAVEPDLGRQIRFVRT